MDDPTIPLYTKTENSVDATDSQPTIPLDAETEHYIDDAALEPKTDAEVETEETLVPPSLLPERVENNPGGTPAFEVKSKIASRDYLHNGALLTDIVCETTMTVYKFSFDGYQCKHSCSFRFAHTTRYKSRVVFYRGSNTTKHFQH